MSEEHSAESGARQPGWQQSATPRRRTPPKCPHLGLMFAQMAAGVHAEGHEWVCGCGQVFVVVSNGGQNKRLVKDWRTRPTPPGGGGSDA